MRIPNSGGAAFLPGNRPGRVPGTSDYLITLRDDADAPRGGGRRAVIERGIARTEAFQRRLHNWLECRATSGQAHIGEATPFAMVPVTTTPEIAEEIRREFPEVEDVVPDEDSLAFIR